MFEAELRCAVKTVEIPKFLLFLLDRILLSSEEEAQSDKKEYNNEEKIDIVKLKQTFDDMLKEAVAFCNYEQDAWKETLHD